MLKFYRKLLLTFLISTCFTFQLALKKNRRRAYYPMRHPTRSASCKTDENCPRK